MAEMKIVELFLRDIKPYDKNPRKNEKAVDAVMNSIKEFGFKNPIIVDEDLVIISGHTRRLAALKLSMEKVPCIIAKDLTEEQVRAFRLADNRVASFSTWDEEKLKQEIGDINNIDLSDFGFKKDKIDDVQNVGMNGKNKGAKLWLADRLKNLTRRNLSIWLEWAVRKKKFAGGFVTIQVKKPILTPYQDGAKELSD